VGTASRLLAMKRPDLFVCIDSENRPHIAKAFGVPASSLLTFDGYWDPVQRIWHCPWWRAPRPNDELERRAWNARVALLDSLFREATLDKARFIKLISATLILSERVINVVRPKENISQMKTTVENTPELHDALFHAICLLHHANPQTDTDHRDVAAARELRRAG
jgi:hypothetical protein